MNTAMKFGTVSMDNIVLGGSGIALLEVQKTISTHLSKEELMRYADAISKVGAGQKLNRQDVKILDRIDEITMRAHGLCLKDSMVTKARIKAAKRYGMQFMDRDGLVEHMNMMLGETSVVKEKDITAQRMASDFLNAMGMEKMTQFSAVIRNIEQGIALDSQALALLEEIDAVGNSLYNWAIVNEKVLVAMHAAQQQEMLCCKA